MRPTRLELSGFASFRDPCVVDFADADLFVLSGATGAGKSSVVDSMVFALYGAVPRYGDRRRVEPVISKTADEARVRLDFTVDATAYTAVRVVRRTATGATTKEARLERATPGAPQTLAATADEVSQQVERLLGLSFEHFTTSVVLPQGEFQRFLHATGKERQDLLVELLDLDVYREVGRRARARAAEASGTAAALERRLDGELAGATDEARRQVAERVATLAELKARVDAAQPELDRIREQGSELRAAHQQALARREALSAVAVPDDVAALGERLAQARADGEAAQEALAAATRERDAAEQAEESLPDAASVRELHQLLLDEADLARRLDQAVTAVHEAATRLAVAREDEQGADARMAAAREHLEQARQADLAATLAADLHAGDDCPICARPLDRAPVVEGADAVQDARARVAESRSHLQQAADAARRAEAAHATATSTRDGLAAQRERTSGRIGELRADGRLPSDLDAVAGALQAASSAHERVVSARRAERQARAQQTEATRRRATLDAERDRAWEAFDGVRDRVAALEPPPVSRDDLPAAWARLADWAAKRARELDDAVARAEKDVEDAARRWREHQDELRRACGAAGLDDRGDPREVCVTALSREQGRLQRLEEQLDEAAKVRAQLADARHDERVAKSLGDHLHATRFERWLLNRALRLLVTGASRILRELTGGAYSLGLDDGGGFEVVDHRNVDTRRPARTLSGGETFLASLALALALAEHVADFAAHGSARLESLFLDEGFGTLDPDTLDTVAAAIEELGAQGRMVGLVTHVRELAERMPLRYEVSKVGGCSQVVRVDAATTAGAASEPRQEGA